MVNLTKKERYDRKVVEGIMDNYLELKLSYTEGSPDHMLPIYDYERAIERIELTKSEQEVFDAKYPLDDFSLSGGEAAELLGHSPAHISKTVAKIIPKIQDEMNRGLSDD